MLSLLWRINVAERLPNEIIEDAFSVTETPERVPTTTLPPEPTTPPSPTPSLMSAEDIDAAFNVKISPEEVQRQIEQRIGPQAPIAEQTGQYGLFGKIQDVLLKTEASSANVAEYLMDLSHEQEDTSEQVKGSFTELVDRAWGGLTGERKTPMTIFYGAHIPI